MPRDLFVTNDNRLEELRVNDITSPVQTHAYDFYAQVRGQVLTKLWKKSVSIIT